ncbi:hypothetical protein EAG_02275 [Camponotus floridanus]|uniref:Retrovirus-related Pol polyprotein from type-1 retrotransposable element R1 n=1 Tax=Camponotus floridanus TaxID=104421 RepID=E2AM82_CAMFO|nr:hypothetical protein EAG_02275 [Camponotus floridanus]
MVYAESGVRSAWYKADLLARKLIFKSFATKPNIFINKLQNLHFAHMDSGFRSGLYDRFPLYRAYRFMRDYKCGIVEHLDCPCGSSQQDINHVLWSCPLLSGSRVQLTKALERVLNVPPPYNIFEILKAPSIEVVHPVISLHGSGQQI